MQVQRPIVMLLKSSADDEEKNEDAAGHPTDPYVSALADENLDAHCVTALNFIYINPDVILKSLRNPHEYSCLILSSAKSVEAVLRSVNQSEWTDVLCPQWKNKRTYVVGEATNKAAKKLGLTTYGFHSGNSEALADVIIQDMYDAVLNVEVGPALFLCSSIKLDLLPTKIRAEGIKVQCVDAYDTIPSANLDTDLIAFHSSKSISAFNQQDQENRILINCRKALKLTKHKNLTTNTLNADARLQGYPSCVVFYSPSGVRAALPLMKARDWPLSDIHVIAIGPTTEDELRHSGVQEVFTAEQPKPPCVAETCQMALHQTNTAAASK